MAQLPPQNSSHSDDTKSGVRGPHNIFDARPSMEPASNVWEYAPIRDQSDQSVRRLRLLWYVGIVCVLCIAASVLIMCGW
jgi:hypothetical protein